MNGRRAVDVFATLERRAAAALRAAVAERHRLATAGTAQIALARGARAALVRHPVWSSALCWVVERRTSRAAVAHASYVAGAADVDRDIRAFESRHRHWARLVRGLGRRAARIAESEPLWVD